MSEDEDCVPSELREHINAEQLRPDAALFGRSIFSTVRFALTPYLFVAVVVILASTETFSPLVLVVSSLPLFLAAQRCLQTMVHDLSHKLFSVSMPRNDLLGNYLVAGWAGVSVPAYRAVHLQHHKYNGSTLDPEFISFETVRNSGGLALHCIRYIVGLEAVRLINKYYGQKPENEASQSKSLKASKFHILVCQLVLAAVFIWIAGAWYLYLVWIYLAITFNPLLSNLRFLAEHPGDSDLTVSTPSNYLERLYFAPFNFNCHLEHHLWPNLQSYHLAAAHRYLLEQGYFDRHPEFLGSSFIRCLRNRK